VTGWQWVGVVMLAVPGVALVVAGVTSFGMKVLTLVFGSIIAVLAFFVLAAALVAGDLP
jgi:hypothetical protein